MAVSSLLPSCPGQSPLCFPILLLAFSSSADPILYLNLFPKGPDPSYKVINLGLQGIQRHSQVEKAGSDTY